MPQGVKASTPNTTLSFETPGTFTRFTPFGTSIEFSQKGAVVSRHTIR